MLPVPGTYLPRLLDPVVNAHLAAFGAVELAGTMWSGKTWTARRHGNSEVNLDVPQSRHLAELDPEVVLAGEAPRVVDEWQEVPSVWDAVRRRVDDAPGQRGLYILTGSSRPAKGEARHTGSGRISRLRMWPMSLQESGDSTGQVSLAELFEGRFAPGPAQTDLRRLAQLAVRGGWPGALGLEEAAAALVPRQYVDALVASQDSRAPASGHELLRVLEALARNLGSAVSLKTLAADVGRCEPSQVTETDQRRLRACLDYLLDRYVITELCGWDAPIKSPRRLRTKPKHCFADPSLACALLGLDAAGLLGNLQVFGQVFEELCLRDLRVYAAASSLVKADGLRYYRDSDGLEADAVIELCDGRWGAIEVKLGAHKAEAAEKSLLRLKAKVAANPAARNPKPSFLLVLVGKTDYRYTLPSGVHVAPITDLGA